MSPLWRDEIGVFVGPSKVILARMRRGIRPKCIAEQGISVDASHAGHWQPAIDTLRQQVANELWQDTNLRLVVSDLWARYAVLPWSAEISGTAERLAHARLILNNMYGEVADQWTIALSENRPRTATVVSAIPTQLIDDIRSAVSQNKIRLISLQPHLIVAFNGWRNKVPDSSAWFASIDEGSLAALHLTDGHCDRVRSIRISDDWAVELNRMQTMGRLAQGRSGEGPVFVDAPVWLRESADTSNTALEWLVEDRAPQNIAEKVSLLKGTYA